MASQPLFYIVRPGTVRRCTAEGDVVHEPNIVPLIPADLLPDYIELEGVYRHLSFAETAGMTNLGYIAAAEEPYRVRFNLPQSDENDSAGVEEGNGLATPNLPGSTSRCNEAGHEGGDGDYVNDSNGDASQYPLQDARRGTGPKPPQGLASSRHNTNSKPSAPTDETSSPPRTVHQRDQPSPSVEHASKQKKKKKLFCSHFVNHGWCRFGENCHFKHVIPQTAEGLKSVGLRNWPQWLLDYMHTEQLPALPPQDSGARSRKGMSEGIQSDVVGETGKGMEGSSTKEEAKTEAVKKRDMTADLIDL